MSSRAVRVWFRSEIVLRAPSIPFLETVNKAPGPKDLPDLWATIEFANATEQRLTLGRRALFREVGQATLIVLGLSGRSDEDVMLAAEQLRAAFNLVAVQVPVGAEVGTLRIDAPDVPNTDSTESGNWFLASVSCSYTFDVMRGTEPDLVPEI